MNIGDRVEIIRQGIFHLKHRKIRTGVIKKIDGTYIDVRPSWCWWVTELYPNEIKVLGKWRGKKRIRGRR